MIEYLVEAIKEENGVVSDSWNMYEYPTKEEALSEAKVIAEGGSSINPKLMGYTDILVHECKLDDNNETIQCDEIASFKVK